jgi:hypothetical protein
MALVVTIMAILTQTFAEGVKTFRDLKAVGDLNERLLTASAQLRRDLADAHFDAASFIADTYRNGKPNREDAAALRARYAAIAADARVLEAQFRQVELRTTNPAGKRVLRRIQETLDLIEWHAGNMVAVIRAIEDDDDDGESSGRVPLNVG